MNPSNTLELRFWQVKAGSVFGNFLVTDDVDLAKSAAEAILTRVDGEKAAETKADEAERAKAAAEAGDDEEEEDQKEDL